MNINANQHTNIIFNFKYNTATNHDAGGGGGREESHTTLKPFKYTVSVTFLLKPA